MRMATTLFICLLPVHLMPGAASAASDDAWAELFGRARTACLKASGFRAPETIGEPVDFTDTVLVLVRGQFPQAHMKGQRGVAACLYGKTSRKAESQELPAGAVVTKAIK